MGSSSGSLFGLVAWTYGCIVLLTERKQGLAPEKDVHSVRLATSYLGIVCCAALRNISTPRYIVAGVVYEPLTRSIGDCIVFEVSGRRLLGVKISGALIASGCQIGRSIALSLRLRETESERKSLRRAASMSSFTFSKGD